MSPPALANIETNVRSVEIVGSEDNRWLIIHHSTGAFSFPQNGQKNPQELVGADIVYTTDYYSRRYNIYNNGHQIFYSDNIAMVQVDGRTIYTNPAYREFLRERCL